ncbi:MAG TPA: UDP-glucose/GDP-mannose dehydrogenase family protein [Polyangiaceae bacterium]
MKIAIIGTGYVGLVAGACFADTGTEVVCVDVDEDKLQRLSRGEVTFYEPRLSELVLRNWPTRLRFSSNLEQSIDDCAAVFIAVGTPPSEDGSADLSHVLGAAEQVARLARHDLVLVLKSTVPVGTNQMVRQLVSAVSGHTIHVVSNPEFLKEGDAVNDFLKPDRVVVGTDSDVAFSVLERLYAPFVRQNNRIQHVSACSAEIVKYAANALLATKISFMNEIAALADAAGGDVEQVRLALGADSRIGYSFLFPGLGFGGSCFPKDLRALVQTAGRLGVPCRVAAAAIQANQEPLNLMLTYIERGLGDLHGKTLAVWGLSFKPGTDDVREAPALLLIERLVHRGAKVRATDPKALRTAAPFLGQAHLSDSVQVFDSHFTACEGADAVVVATEWPEYRNPDFGQVARLMRGKYVFDGRNVLLPRAVVDAGLTYRGMGRPELS